MTLQNIVQHLLKDPKLSKKYDEKYLKSVVEEQLFLRDYKKTFEQEINEDSITDDEEDDEIELAPEEIPQEEPEKEEIPDKEPEIEQEPELELPPEDKEQPEPETQPQSDDSGEVEVEPSKIPQPSPNIPKKDIDNKIDDKESEEDGYIRISPKEAQELLSYKGKVFTAIFTKRSDGSLRSLNGMTGVRKYTSGGELPYSPKEKELIPVYDLKIGPGPKGYRTIPIEGLKALKINGKKYKIDQSLQENMKKSTLYQVVKEAILEMRETQPQRVSPDREVIEKPETDTPERKPKRRTLTPPTESPETKPKAEGVEKNLANKMADRFQKLK